MNNNSKYECKICNYCTDIKSRYDAHLKTKKHISKHNISIGELPNDFLFNCEKCAKNFKTNSGLWKHKKCCSAETQNNTNNIVNHNNYSNNTNNSNSFNTTNNNLNIFLNNECAAAINIDEFVSALKIRMEDLNDFYDTRRGSFVKALVRILVKNIENYSIYKRPLHCIKEIGSSIIHFRDENIWKSEDFRQEMPILQKFIDNVMNHSIIKMPRIVGTNNSGKFKFMKIKKVIIKLHKNKTYNTKVIKDLSKNIIIPDVPAKSLYKAGGCAAGAN
jgi:hypothetical protein